MSKFFKVKSTYTKVDNETMTMEEERAVYDYTEDAYHEINKYLRGDLEEVPEYFKVTIDKLDSALNKIENYEGEVHRTLRLLPDSVQQYVNQFEVGEIKMFKEFLSTSYGDYYMNGNVVFEIKSKTGKKVEQYAWNKNEQEVLFRRNSTFLIKNIRYESHERLASIFDNNKDVYIIEMEEVILGE